MRTVYFIAATAGGIVLLLILGAITWKWAETDIPNIPSPSATPIPLEHLPALPGPLTYAHNVSAQITGQIARARFSSDPTAAPVAFSSPPHLTAFLHNSTPCAAAGQQTTYRIAVHGASEHAADNISIHLVVPPTVSLTSLSQPYEQYEPETHSYFWLVPAPLAQNETFIIDTGGTIAATTQAQAQLIVTYTGLEDDDIRHVVSTRTLAACGGV